MRATLHRIHIQHLRGTLGPSLSWHEGGLRCSAFSTQVQPILHGKGQSIDAQVHVTETMMPGVVSLPHGWGHDKKGARLALAAERPGVNLNDLLDEQLRDPLSGNSVLSGIEVQIASVQRTGAAIGDD